MFGSPATLLGRGCAQNSERTAAVRALAKRLGLSSPCDMNATLRGRLERAFVANDAAVARLEAAQAVLDQLNLAAVEEGEDAGDPAEAEAALEAAEMEAVQACEAVEGAEAALQTLRLELEQKARATAFA